MLTFILKWEVSLTADLLFDLFGLGCFDFEKNCCVKVPNKQILGQVVKPVRDRTLFRIKARVPWLFTGYRVARFHAEE